MRNQLITNLPCFVLTRLCAAAWVCATLLVPLCVAGETTTVGKIRGNYEKALATLGSNYDATAKEEFARYGKSLDAFAKALRKKGDLDGLIAARNEKKRFDSERTIPKPNAKIVTSIDKLRANYYSRLSNARIKKQRGIISVTQRYVASLEHRKKVFTQENKIEQALACKKEIARVNASGAVAAAEFVLAEEGYEPEKKAPVAKPAAPASAGPVPLLVWQGPRDADSINGSTKGVRRKHKLARTGDSRIGRKGMECGGGRILVEGANKVLLDACRASNELSIEAKITPDNLKQFGPARIISFSQDGYKRNFTIGQDRNKLQLRLRTTETGLNGMHPEVTLCKLEPNKEHRILLSYKPGELAFYLNGKKLEVRQFGGDFSNWEEYQLLFGNEWKDDRAWRGNISYIAIYDRAIKPSLNRKGRRPSR